MAAMQLTYDAVEDRVLLRSNQRVSYPSWWISRRNMKRLVQSLNSAVAAHYETEKILKKVSEAKTSETSNGDGRTVSGEAEGEQGLDAYRREKLEVCNASIEKSGDAVTSAQRYPYARVIRLDLVENNRVALVFADGREKGLKIEFSEDGIYSFSNMCTQIMQQCKW